MLFFCISLLCVRLPEVVLQIPVALNAQRGVQIRFARNDNITAVVEGFVDFYELTEVYIIWSSYYLLGYDFIFSRAMLLCAYYIV
jgi:hypothetical protein